MNINFKFVNSFQENVFYSTYRNQCGSGGYGNGKTLGFCMKVMYLSSNYRRYRTAIARRQFKDLRNTTMKTFFKICPYEAIARHNEQDGITVLVNGSEILWLNLDHVEEQTLRGLEINSAFLDQCEEIDENIFDTVQARVGRWDNAEPPQALVDSEANWPRNAFTDRPLAPAYMMAACNPDSELHYLYRKFHPDSPEWQESNREDYMMYQAASDENPALDPATLKAMKDKDPEWVRRFVFGQWGITGGSIHTILPISIIDPSPAWLENFLKKANLYRTFDHGESSPSCCLWFASFNGIHICYREYYSPNNLISEHRANIGALSGEEKYSGNFADPSIFDKLSQRKGGRYSTSDEYADKSLCTAPPIYWQPADNNELGIRNRINEALKLDPKVAHPLTGEMGSSKLYFVKKTSAYPNGCDNVLIQARTQRRDEVGTLNGKKIFSDNRDDKITDHAYDPLRYYFGLHTQHKENILIRPPANSFFNVRKQFLLLKSTKDTNRLTGRPAYQR